MRSAKHAQFLLEYEINTSQSWKLLNEASLFIKASSFMDPDLDFNVNTALKSGNGFCVRYGFDFYVNIYFFKIITKSL